MPWRGFVLARVWLDQRAGAADGPFSGKLANGGERGGAGAGRVAGPAWESVGWAIVDEVIYARARRRGRRARKPRGVPSGALDTALAGSDPANWVVDLQPFAGLPAAPGGPGGAP